MKSNQTVVSAEPQKTENEHLTIELLRAALMGRIAGVYLDIVAERPGLARDFNKNVLTQTIQQLQRFDREVHRTTKGGYKTYLRRDPSGDKLLDMANVLDCMARIGCEEHKGRYEEFLGLLMDLLDAVFYAQKNRRNLHFGKYKALFALIQGEIRRDTNREPSQLLFTNQGELFLRTAPPVTTTELK